jgi:predicted membrane protein
VTTGRAQRPTAEQGIGDEREAQEDNGIRPDIESSAQIRGNIDHRRKMGGSPRSVNPDARSPSGRGSGGLLPNPVMGTVVTFRRLSLLFALVGALLIMARVDFAEGHESALDRAVEAILMIGTISSFLHGFGLRPASRVVQLLADPRFTWSAILLGGLYLALR